MATFYCTTCKRVSTSKKGGTVPKPMTIAAVANKYGVYLNKYDFLKQYQVVPFTRPNGLRGKRKQCPYCAGQMLEVVKPKEAKAEAKADKKNDSSFGGKYAGQRADKQFTKARFTEEESSEKASNIEVGDFLSELASAIRFRARLGLKEGDWMEEPERAYTDGAVFAEEITVASSVKLQVTLTLDTSSSMWTYKNEFQGCIMKFAGPAFIAIDRVIRKAIQDLPEGVVKYETFIFNTKAYRLPAAFVNSYVGRGEKADGKEERALLMPLRPKYDQMQAAKRLKQIPETAVETDWHLSGGSTNIEPLFAMIKNWEETEGNTEGVRLDIVLTDGYLESGTDVAQASRIQDERGGRVRTVLLNFLPFNMWSDGQLPDRCAQFAVTPDNLDSSIRNVLAEAIQDLLE